MKAALYHRVSTADQDPTLARDRLERAALARGYEIAMLVEETGSGAKTNRPGLARVMDAAVRGEVSAVLVWKLDRFGRSVLDLHVNVMKLRDAGARLIVVDQALEVAPGSSPISDLLFNVLSAVAEFERELIRERTRLGVSKARERGKRLGRPPEGNVDAVRVAELRAARKSWSAIGAELGEHPSKCKRALERAQRAGLVEEEDPVARAAERMHAERRAAQEAAARRAEIDARAAEAALPKTRAPRPRPFLAPPRPERAPRLPLSEMGSDSLRREDPQNEARP